MPRILAFWQDERQPTDRPKDEQQDDEHADGEAVDLVRRDGAGVLLAVRALHRDGRPAMTKGKRDVKVRCRSRRWPESDRSRRWPESDRANEGVRVTRHPQEKCKGGIPLDEKDSYLPRLEMLTGGMGAPGGGIV